MKRLLILYLLWIFPVIGMQNPVSLRIWSVDNKTQHDYFIVYNNNSYIYAPALTKIFPMQMIPLLRLRDNDGEASYRPRCNINVHSNINAIPQMYVDFFDMKETVGHKRTTITELSFRPETNRLIKRMLFGSPTTAWEKKYNEPMRNQKIIAEMNLTLKGDNLLNSSIVVEHEVSQE